MLPTALATALDTGLADFLRASFWSSTPGMEGVVDQLLATPGGVSKGPWVDLKLPFVAGEKPDHFEAVPLPFLPHAHQENAFVRLGGRRKQSTLVATGTGSGKTESFLVPILAHCEEQRRRGQKGVKAILIYPMNALAADQARRIAKLIHGNERLRGTVRAGMYVGGEKKGSSSSHAVMGKDHLITAREVMREDPPDILLTNYKMLDYLLLRPADRGLWLHNGPGVLRYLVVDELHTFDGAQGTDLACLIRRLKRRLQADVVNLCCVGTSATLGGDEGGDRLRAYASQVFGEDFEPDSVVGEQRVRVGDFLASAPERFDAQPGAEHLGDLDPSAWSDPDAWLARQVGLWLPEAGISAPPEAGSERDAWAVALGDALCSHATFRRLLDYAARRPTPLEELVDALQGSNRDWIRSPRLGRLVLGSLLGMVSAARRWRRELPRTRAAREAEGRPRPADPLLDVRLQGWQRELARMVASVGPEPRLAYSDDLDRDEAKRHLPLIHCKDCGAMGWATRRDRDRPHKLSLDGLKSFYRAFFSEDPTVAFLWPRAAVDLSREGWKAAPALAVDLDDLVTVAKEDEARFERAFSVVQSHNVRTIRPKGGGPARQALDRTCPFCDSDDGMMLVGFRAATLTSVAIDQLFASPFNDDKKLLTFSDSVQDAAHRAGFFGARTWRINLRVAAAQTLAEHPDLPLDELPPLLRERWETKLGHEGFVATFLPLDMDWLHDWTDMVEKGGLRASSNLPDLVAERLTYELLQEFALQSGVGRSLERTGTAVARLDGELLLAAVGALLPIARNELPNCRDLSMPALLGFLRVFVRRVRSRGGVLHPILPESYLGSAGDRFFAFTRSLALPNMGPSSRMPAFLVDRPVRGRFSSWHGGGKVAKGLDALVQRTLHEGRTLGPQAAEVLDLVAPRLVELGILDRVEGPKGTWVYGVAPGALRLTTEVTVLRCARCSRPQPVATQDAEAWCGLPCQSPGCGGVLARSGKGPDDYFRRLYENGDLQRIHAHEHTGLLEREVREKVEDRFKSSDPPPGWSPAPDGSDATRWHRPWDPNLLSCTPTLEMGIDVGDLSSTILCSVPPAQANYLQRIGRAGRRDGNALILTVANARPHDRIFYEDPEQMISGAVQPPGVYLDAAAVLERHLAAFAFDQWVENMGADARIPRTLGAALDAVSTGTLTVFPYPFLDFVEEHEARLYGDFREMFQRWSNAETLALLDGWLSRPKDEEGAFAQRLLQLLEREAKAQAEWSRQARRLSSRIEEHEAIPASARAEDWKDELARLKQEQAAISGLFRAGRRRQLLEFLTDAGFLPNYAFPEAPVRLESVIWRRKRDVPANGRAYETWENTYRRSPSQALGELAPFSDFYAGGRKLTIDRVDVSTKEIEEWRFCPACSHAEHISVTGDAATDCPACGCRSWRDPGQKQRLLRLRQVYASASARKSRISDDRDERVPRFHLREMLVEHHAEHRVVSYELADPVVPFGVEYLRRATFRDINFGEPTEDGVKTSINGVESVRPGYTLCGACGQVQRPRQDGEDHHPSCTSKKAKSPAPLEQSLHLYREFHSEALRLLLPLSDVAVTERLQSFLAALALGLRERFGGKVDHLRTLTTTQPIEGSAQRKQFVVVYDSVPGGTGYLKQLITKTDNGRLPLFEVFELARDRVRDCVCRTTGEDGCYRCLVGYRNSRDHDAITATMAEQMLNDLLDREGQLRECESLHDVEVTGLQDSHLEARFIEALKKLDGFGRVKLTLQRFGAKQGWRYEIGAQVWEILPQVEVHNLPGLKGHTRPDYMMRRANGGPDEAQIAVYLDGWTYHHHRVDDDLRKRQALLASGRFDVWTFTWADLDAILLKEHSAAPEVVHEDPPAFALHAERLAPLRGLHDALQRPLMALFGQQLASDGELTWRALGMGLFETRMQLGGGQAPLEGWRDALGDAVPESLQRRFSSPLLRHIDLGGLNPRVTSLLGLDPKAGPLLACCLDDRGWDPGEPADRASWAAFLRLFQLYRHLPGAVFSTRTRSEAHWHTLAPHLVPGPPQSGWAHDDEIEPEYRDLAVALETAGVPAPDDVGEDLPDDRDGTWGMAEWRWLDAKVALVPRDEMERALRPVAPSWTLLCIDDPVDPSALLTLLNA